MTTDSPGGGEPNIGGMRLWTTRRGDERRLYERIVLPVGRCFILVGPSEEGVTCEPQVLDVSRGGLRFRDRTPGHPLRSNVRVTLELVFAGEDPIYVSGVVVWTSNLDDGLYDGGIRFDTASREVGGAIRRYIERMK